MRINQADKRFWIMVLAIVAIIILGSIYLLMGHNSFGFTLLISSLVGLGGWALPSPLRK